MNIINDKKKFNIDAVKAINLIFFNEIALSLLTNITKTPIIGIKSKDDNNIYKQKINKFLLTIYYDNVSYIFFINTINILR